MAKKIGITVILHSPVINFSRRTAIRRYEFITILSIAAVQRKFVVASSSGRSGTTGRAGK